MNITELKLLLATTIISKLPVMIAGSPGIGKSETLDQVSEEMKIDLMILHPVTSDPVDFKGMPAVDVQKMLADFIPFGDLKRMMEATEPLIVFIDDLGQAPPAVQAAIMQLPQAREINGKKISDHVIFIAATNRKQDKAGVSGILEPLKSRFIIVELQADVDSWTQWATRNNMPPEIVAFIRFRPDLLDDFQATADMTNSPCPRTVTRVGQLMNANLPEELWHETFAGCVGEGWTAEFMGFMSIYKTLPNIQEIVNNPNSTPIPADAATQYALCGMITHMVDMTNHDALFQYFEKMPLEFQTVIINDINETKKEITGTARFTNWCSRNADVFI